MEVRIVLALLHSKANTISEINKPPLLQCSYQISKAFVVLLKTAFSTILYIPSAGMPGTSDVYVFPPWSPNRPMLHSIISHQ